MSSSVASAGLLETPTMLETLEDRIAPATMTFTESDGDLVAVISSKGTEAQLKAVATFMNATSVTDGELRLLELKDDPVFAGTSLKIAVIERGAMGDGQVNVGFIDAKDMDLGAVTIKGDIAKIVAGDTNHKTPGLASLTAQSIGVFGLATQGNMGDLKWEITGGTKTFNVAGDVDSVSLKWESDDVTVGSITIGGNLLGGGTAGSGQIVLVATTGTSVLKSLVIGGDVEGTDYDYTGYVTAGIIGKVSIEGDVIGAANSYSGNVHATVSMGDVIVGGNLAGGGGLQSGSVISVGTLGAVKVGGDLIGDAGAASGAIHGNASIKSVTVSGSLTGGTGATSGAIIGAAGAVGNVKVDGSLTGNNGTFSGSIYGSTGLGNVTVGGLAGGAGQYSGTIFTQDDFKVGNVTVGNSVVGGSGPLSGSISGGTLGAVKIGGDLEGGTVAGSGVIFANTTLTSVAIGGDLIGGSAMESGRIFVAPDGGAKVKFISVGGDLIGGGAMAADEYSGTINVVGSIDKLTVGGSIIGGVGEYSGTIMGPAGNSQSTAINTVFIGGNIEGGTGDYSGNVVLTTNKTFTVVGGIIGGAGVRSGVINTAISNTLSVGVTLNGNSLEGGSSIFSGQVVINTLGKATFAGSFVGGTNDYSGYLYFGTAKDVAIGGSLIGVGGQFSGAIDAGSVTGTLKVSGSVVGGTDESLSGSIHLGSAKTIQIGGSIRGGDATMGSIFNSGAVLVTGHVGTFTLGGSLYAGDAVNFTNMNLGAIRAGSFGSLTIKGDVIGNATHEALITGQGNIDAVSGKNLAIGTLTINGKVSYANILGGYDTVGSTLNGSGGTDGGSAQIGTVTVKGSWSDSSIATGAAQTTGVWGAGNNVALTKPAGSSIVASIAKIVINGPVTSPNVTTGIVAESVLGLVLSGFNASTTDGAQVGSAANMHIELV